MRKSYTKEVKKEIVRNFYSSGLSKAEYCRKNNLSIQSFYNWIKQHCSGNELEFVSVVLPNKTPKVKSNKIILELTSGTKLKFSSTTCSKWLANLLREL